MLYFGVEFGVWAELVLPIIKLFFKVFKFKVYDFFLIATKTLLRIRLA